MSRLSLLALSLGLVAGTPLVATVASDAADHVGLDELAHGLAQVGAAEAAFIRRGKLKKRPSIGYKVVVVVGEDTANDEVNSVEVTIAADPGSPEPAQSTIEAPLRAETANGNKRFVFNQLGFPEDAVGSSYTMTSTMKDINGAVIGTPDTSTVTVLPDGDPRVRTVRVTQLDDTNFRLQTVVVGDSEGDVDSTTVSFTDYSGPAPIPEELSLQSGDRSGGKVTFTDNTLTFDDPAGAADEVYTVLVDILDASGVSLGSSELELVVAGITDPFDDLATTANTSEYLQDIAVIETNAAASLLGRAVVAGTESFAVSSSGGIAYTAQLGEGDVIVVPEGSGVLEVDGNMTPLTADIGAYVQDFPSDGEASEEWVLTTYDINGVALSVQQGPIVTGAGFDQSQSLRLLTGPEFDNVFIRMAYGDIIIGGMRLCDFND